jgi:hypothetical protein
VQEEMQGPSPETRRRHCDRADQDQPFVVGRLTLQPQGESDGYSEAEGLAERDRVYTFCVDTRDGP